MKSLLTLNRVLLGLLMLGAGIVKIFVTHPSGVAAMLSKNLMFAWAPVFWAWVLIIGEIGSGLAVLGNWKLRYVVFIPIFVLTIAVLTMVVKWSSLGTTNWTSLIFHLIAINGFIILGVQDKKK